MFKLSKEMSEYIVTAYAEPAAGPGWSNTPIWIVINNVLNKMRLECLQPEQQSAEMRTLYEISTAVNSQMKHAVNKHCS